MAHSTLKALDERILQLLRDSRKAAPRAAEPVAVVHDLSTEPLPLAERAAMARRIAAMTPTDVRQTDSVLLLREDRDR